MEQSLEVLAKSNNMIFLDTCASFYLDGFRISERNAFLEVNIDSFRKFRQVAEKTSRIYITHKVSQEFCNYISNDNSGLVGEESIGDIRRSDTKYYRDNLRKRRRLLTKERKTRGDFIEYLESTQKVLDYSDAEYYKTIDEICKPVKNHCKISDTDWDFLITGVIASSTNSPVCLISNDFGIGQARNMFLECNLFKEGDLNLYLRGRFDSYIKFNHPK